jgi:polysaccharide export outer membrane protein
MPPDGPALSTGLHEINQALASEALRTPEGSPDASPDYRIGPEDLLQITLFNVPEAEAGVTPRRTEVRVSQEGVVTLPLLGDLHVRGMTPGGLERLLRGRYERYLHNPAVGVRVLEYRAQRVSVIGAVQRPGVFQLSGPSTVADLLAMAGGVTTSASSQVHLFRQSPEGRQSYIINLWSLARDGGLTNLAVQPGDVLSIPQAGMFFVDGAVRRPGSYPLSRRYSLTQVLVAAGGVNEELAKTSAIAIFRHQGDAEVEKIPVDLSEIRAGKAKDPQIEAEDVIVVPMSTPKYLVRRFLGTIGLGSVPLVP